MPEGLQAAMTLTDFADLIAYLETLKENGAKQPVVAKTRAVTVKPTALRSPKADSRLTSAEPEKAANIN